MKKFDSTPRKITEILHPFYYYDVYYDGNLKEKYYPTKLDDHPSEKYINEDGYDDLYDFYYEGYRRIKDIALEEIVDTYNKIKEYHRNYSDIKLFSSSDINGYEECPCVMGIRIETDEEIEVRRKDYKAELFRIEKEKTEKQQKILENKRKKLEKLKRELEA